MSKIFDLTGKVALVTGASSGLGWHFARALSAAGADVALAARRRERLAKLIDDLEARGGKAAAITMDVTISQSVAEGYAQAEAELGPVDIVVNNAGITIVKPPLELAEEEWDQVISTNLRGAWLVAQSGARRMVATGRPGRIINIASILGLRTIGQVAPYNAAKAGLLHLTRVLAMEWARYNIQVNAISPGYIETEMNQAFWQTSAGRRLIERVPQRRLGKPSDLDGALLLLASDAGAFMTGANIVVDGGHVASSL